MGVVFGVSELFASPSLILYMVDKYKIRPTSFPLIHKSRGTVRVHFGGTSYRMPGWIELS